MYFDILCILFHVSHVCSAYGGKKRVLGTLELELQIALSQHMGAVN